MSLKLKCHLNWNVAKTEILLEQNVTETKYQLNKMSLKLKLHQNWFVTKSEMSLKLKCHLN